MLTHLKLLIHQLLLIMALTGHPPLHPCRPRLLLTIPELSLSLEPPCGTKVETGRMVGGWNIGRGHKIKDIHRDSSRRDEAMVEE